MPAPLSDQERRQFQRILFDAEIDIQMNGEHYISTLLDISLNGALINKPAGWPDVLPTKECTLTVKLDKGKTAMYMQTEIAHLETKAVGLRCKQIDMDSITLLRNLVEYNMDDPDLLEREFEALG